MKSSYIPRDTSKFVQDETHNYFTTSYRHDVSEYGGETFRVPEDEKINVDVPNLASTKKSIGRQMQQVEMNGAIFTPDSTYRASYVCHGTMSRDVQPSFNGLVPPPMPLPDAPDESIFRATTEYGAKYRGKPGEPMLNQTTLQRCYETQTMKSRSIDLPTRAPQWETTYRDSYCNKVTDLKTSPAITTHNMTHIV